jgi:hypothetical protein
VRPTTLSLACLLGVCGYCSGMALSAAGERRACLHPCHEPRPEVPTLWQRIRAALARVA